MNTLLIGGPKDGEKMFTNNTYLKVATMPKYNFSHSYEDDLPVQVTTHTYRQLLLGKMCLHVHESLTDDQALERLFKRYRKTYKKKL